MLEFLPQNVKEGLRRLNIERVYEIRLRVDKPTMINYAGQYRYLSEYGLTERPENAVVCDADEIAGCVFRAGQYSVYSVEEQIKRGYITAINGERIGLAGEYVLEKGQPLAVRNFSSLCIRVPHEVVGCGMEIYKSCMRDRIRNTLIASSPGLGKTTILRDLGRILSERTKKNILICDERGEISAGDTGETCDVLKYADKNTAFEAGIRAMRPDVVITDELSLIDCNAIEKAVFAGIKVIASAHFSEMERIQKPFLGLFERYVLLDEQEIGKIKAVYDETGREMR